ncbi:MAG TPA: branched-chain amino acid ABC transporter substrate-binding protein [Paracoccaceae bacterium]|nr:branched-chain amino acid ABC transporter substrate-binding protein [Paracoccaceae bacterium]
MNRTDLLHRMFMAVGLAAALAFAPAGGTAEAKDKIKIGFIGPLSGGNAQQGLGARNGFLLAIEQKAGDDYPYEVEPVVLDDASDPQTGVSAAMKLVNDPDVVAATGHWNSPVALATIPVFNRAGMPFIIWGAIGPSITDQNLPEITRVTPTLAAENLPLAAWAVENLGKRIAIVSDTSDYGTSNAENFGGAVRDNGGEVIAEDLLPVGTTDFRSVLTRIKGMDPDAVYFGGVITEAGILRKQMIDLGVDVPMLGISGIYDVEFIAIAGDAAEGTMAGYPAAQTNPKLDQLTADYEARGFSEPTSPYTKYAYEAASIILEAIQEVGIDDKAALAQAIRDIEYEGVLGTTTFDENGQTEVPVEIEIHEVKGGKWVPREE